MEQQIQVKTASPVKGEAVILDETSYESLRNMFKSGDNENIKIAQLILAGCDIQKSIYWIWKLSRGDGFTHIMVNLRTKAGRNFRDMSKLFTLSVSPPTKFLMILATEDWLTPEIYSKLESKLINHLKFQCDNLFYDVEIKIKSRYEHLTETKTPIKISYEKQ